MAKGDYTMKKYIENMREKVNEIREIDCTKIFECKSHYNDYKWLENEKITFFYKDNQFRYREGSEYGDIFHFMQKYFNKDFYEAIEYFCDISNGDIVKLKYEKTAEQIEKEKIDKKNEKELEKNGINKWDKIIIDNKFPNNLGTFRYLTKDRFINEEIVNWMLDKGYMVRGGDDRIKYDKDMDRYNKKDKSLTYFVMKNPWTGKTTGLIGRENRDLDLVMDDGTKYKAFKKNFSGCEYGFNIKKGLQIDTIIAFEAAIDLLSFLQLHGKDYTNTLFVAIGGANKGILAGVIDEALERENPKELILAFDNDSFGNSISAYFKGRYEYDMEVNRKIPELYGNKFKDWNDILKEIEKYRGL